VSAIPYFEADGVTLYCGDCRALAPDLGDFDLILADPPYAETSLEWDKAASGWPGILIGNVLRRNGSMWVFGSMRSFLAGIGELSAWRLAQDVVWEKHNGSSFHADRFKRVHENVVQFYPIGTPWGAVYKAPVFVNEATARTIRRKTRPPHTGHIDEGHYVSEDGGPKLMRSVLYVRSCHGHAEHPTQKPTELSRPLIEYSCPPHGRVLVPFAGAGSELLAARELGRAAVGIENDEGYCEIIARRLSGLLPLAEVRA
jgi:site-specific DNA-methyltransferase (adenine-specific)